MAAITGLMTFEQFERLPDCAGKQELLQGELIELPPAKNPHSKVAKRIFLSLNDAVEKSGRHAATKVGEAFFETGYRVTRNPDSWLVPDVSVNHPGQKELNRYYEGAPLLAIEVISESNTQRQIARKTKLYLANGAREVWVIDTEERCVVVHRDAADPRRVDGTLETDLIPGLSIDLSSALQ